MIDRLVNRWTCKDCGKIYGTEKSSNDTCPVCNGVLVKRADDNEGTVTKRLNEYKEKTEPVIEYYKNKENVFVKIDGSLSKKEVTKKLISVC